MKSKFEQLVKYALFPLTLCFVVLSTAILGSSLIGNFTEKLNYISLIGGLNATWTIVILLLLSLLLPALIWLRQSRLIKSIWYSFAVLMLYPTVLFCIFFFLSRTTSPSLGSIRNNTLVIAPLIKLYSKMNAESIDNPIRFSRYTLFVEGFNHKAVTDVLRASDHFINDLEKYYNLKLNESIYVIVIDDPTIELAALYGRNVIVIAKNALLGEKGLYALKHEMVHVFNKIHAEKFKVAFPEFIDELVAHRLRLLSGSNVLCRISEEYHKEVEPYMYKGLLQINYEELRKRYDNQTILSFPDDKKTAAMRYSFLDLISCNLNVPLERYLEWVRYANNMSVGDAFKKTFGVDFIKFVARPERVQEAVGKAWLVNKLKALENEN